MCCGGCQPGISVLWWDVNQAEVCSRRMSARQKCVLWHMSTGHKCVAGYKCVGDTTE